MEEKTEITKSSYISFKKIEIIVLIFLISFISLIGGMFGSKRFFDEGVTGNKTLDELKPFIDNYQYILDNYYEDIDKQELINGAIEGMIGSLGDKYSSYLDSSSNSNFQIELNGSFVGIGVSIANTTDSKIIITSIFENSPAAKADLKPGDIVLSIDDLDLTNKKTTEFTDYVKKNDNKEFNIVVKRGEETLEKKLSKALVTIKSVESKMFDNIGYLRVTLFANNTYTQFKKELLELEKQNIDGLIIDLRDNTGGHLNVVQNMISLFLDTSHVIYQTEVKGKKEKFYSSGATTKKYPIVIIANNNSASASEVMIGALKDEYNARLVGLNTYGKGTVQEMIHLSGDTAYKFTTKKWLTPNGTWVDKVGIEPDFIVEQSEEYYTTFEDVDDAQLQKAISVIKE